MAIQRLTIARPLTGRKSICASWSSPTEWLGRSHSDDEGPLGSVGGRARAFKLTALARGPPDRDSRARELTLCARGGFKASGPQDSETKRGFKTGFDYHDIISIN